MKIRIITYDVFYNTKKETFKLGFLNIIMAPDVGLEPTTYRLTAECSTD